jgi:hypothetical protein
MFVSADMVKITEHSVEYLSKYLFYSFSHTLVFVLQGSIFLNFHVFSPFPLAVWKVHYCSMYIYYVTIQCKHSSALNDSNFFVSPSTFFISWNKTLVLPSHLVFSFKMILSWFLKEMTTNLVEEDWLVCEGSAGCGQCGRVPVALADGQAS